MNDEDRIRSKAHEMWEHEGRPEGRAASHWEAAREIVALEDSFSSTLKPLKDTLDEPIEPDFVADNQGDVPGLTDQGEERARPSRAAEAELADEMPLSVDEPKPAKGRKAAAKR